MVKEINWTIDDVTEFHEKLLPLFGRRRLDPVTFVNEVVSLVRKKEKEENGISLLFWKYFFEDHFSLSCGDTAYRRHQKLVQQLKEMQSC